MNGGKIKEKAKEDKKGQSGSGVESGKERSMHERWRTSV